MLQEDIKKEFCLNYEEDEMENFILSRSGYIKSRNQIVSENLGLVRKVVSQYTKDQEIFNDLFQEGCIGLTRAAEKFNPELNNKFSTYAWRWIQSKVEIAISDLNSRIKVPSQVKRQAQSIKRAVRKTEGSFSTKYKALEFVANQFDLDVDTVKRLIEIDSCVTSMQERVNKGDEESSLIEDTIGQDPGIIDEAEMEEIVKWADRAIKDLPSKQGSVMSMFYRDSNFEGNMAMIGKEIGLSREGVRQSHNKAIEKIKEKAVNEAVF